MLIQIFVVSIFIPKHLFDALDCRLKKKKNSDYYLQLGNGFIDEMKVKHNKKVFAICCDNGNKMKKF